MAQLALLGGPKTVTAAMPLWPQLSHEGLAAIRAALNASKWNAEQRCAEAADR